MSPASLMPKALMASPGVVRSWSAPPLGRKKAFVPFPPTTSPALLMPSAIWPAPVSNWLSAPGVPAKLTEVDALFMLTVVPTTWPVLLMPFTLDPTAVPVSGEKSKLVNM